MSAAAIILARAGSQGLPGKNTRDIAGRPCIAWTIDHAQRSTLIDRVVVSSDDARALEFARAMGAETIERPGELASAASRVDEAARHAVTELNDGSLEAVAILYANVPVRPADLTDRAVGRLTEGRFDSVQSYSEVGKHHPLWMAVVDERAGAVSPWQGDRLNNGIFRRQDLPPAHLPDGGALVVSRAALFYEVAESPEGPHGFLGARRGGIVTASGEVVDIDDEIDALVAEAILRTRAAAVV